MIVLNVAARLVLRGPLGRKKYRNYELIFVFYSMKEITLTQGKVALVDDSDYEYLSQWKWHTVIPKTKHTFYAARKTSIKNLINSKRKQVLMHREILCLTDRKIEGEHKDHDGLNNQRNNLRVADRSQNNANRSAQINSSSKFLGVSWIENRKKWAASICKNSHRINLGNFKNEIDAALAYNKKAIELHGEFANLNKVA